MIEHHPYGEFIPKHPKAMIIGSFPIGKFTDPKRRHEIKPHEFDFFFGGEKNLLWKLISHVNKKNVTTLKELKELLEQSGLAIGDVIKSCRRVEGSASDSALYDIMWNLGLLAIIKRYGIKKIYFTSKKVESWFNKLFPDHGLESITLPSPSAQSARGLVRNPNYLKWKLKHPHKRTLDYLKEHYEKLLNDLKTT